MATSTIGSFAALLLSLVAAIPGARAGMAQRTGSRLRPGLG